MLNGMGRSKFFSPLIWSLLTAFTLSALGPAPEALAQSLGTMNPPGLLAITGYRYDPLRLKGLVVHPEDALRFDFLVDKGDSVLDGQELNAAIVRQVKYFLASLAVPEKDLWVNLAPDEQNRIAPDGFGTTQMGRDLLEQDYMLKQMVASLSFPEKELGGEFWKRVYAKLYDKYGTTDIPVETFHKVWIVPKAADVLAHERSVFVVRAELDVMLQKDEQPTAFTEALREVILPELRKEVNEGEAFAPVRQVFNSLILATWYKRHLMDSLLGRGYVGQNHVGGVDVEDKAVRQKIYQRYLSLFRDGIYNYIKEEVDPYTQEVVPRKYVSGGWDFTGFGLAGDKIYREFGEGFIVPPPLTPGENLLVARVGGDVLGARALDTMATLAGAGFTSMAFGADPVSLGYAATVLPFLTRGLYAAHLWVHEFLGHAIPAALLYPGRWREALSGGNLTANMQARQWARILIPFSIPDADPKVRFAADGWRKWVIRKSGLAVTALSATGSVAVGGYLAVTGHAWAIPALGPLTVSAVAVMSGALSTDIADNDSNEYQCGNYGIFWQEKNGRAYPRWVEEGLRGILKRLIVRGGQSAGQVEIESRGGKTKVLLDKVLKNKRGKDLPSKLLGAFRRRAGADREGAVDGGPMVRGVSGHVRYATGGKVTRLASHPHLGPVERQDIWTVRDGRYVKASQEVVVAITHNGDNDDYLLHDRRLNLGEIRDFFAKVVHFDGKLPPGDSPPVALQVHFHLTKGNWRSSVRFAHIMADFTKADDAIQYGPVSVDEEDAVASVFERVFMSYADRLADEASRGQAMSDFRASLVLALEEQKKGSTPAGKVLQAWQKSRNSTEVFVGIAVNKFFSGDRFTAVNEFQSRANGSYGLVVRTSTDTDGVTVYSRNQGMVLGFNDKERYFAFASDPLVLQGTFGEKGRLEKLWMMDLSGQGELADVKIDPQSGISELKVLSLNKGRLLSHDEIAARTFPLSADNPYYQPPVEYPDQDDIVGNDIRQISPALVQAHQVWEDEDSFNRRSAEALTRAIVARYAGKYFREHSFIYGSMRRRLMDYIKELPSTPAREEARGLLEQDKVFRDVFRAGIDQFINGKCDLLAQGILSGGLPGSGMVEWVRRMDHELIVQFKSRAVDVVAALIKEPDSFVGVLRSVTPEIPGFSEEADILVSGYENSLWFGENFKNILNTFFPGLKIWSESSNKILQGGGAQRVTPGTVALIFSKSGGTFPSLAQIGWLKKRTGGNTFVMTSRIDSMMSVALGQGLRPESPFCERVFVTGNYYPAESASLSEALLFEHQVELAIYIAKRVRQAFPDAAPWGMSATADEISRIEQLRGGMLDDAVRITGIDEKGRAVEDKVHQSLVKQGQYLGNHLLETPVVLALFRVFVFGVFILGAPIRHVLGVFGITGGAALATWSGFSIAAADALFAMIVPFLLTAFLFRVFNSRPNFGRLGPPSMAIGDLPFLHQSTESYVTKQGAFSPGSMSMNVRGANPEDHFGARLAHRIVRGTQIVCGLPSEQASRDAVIVTLRQAKGIVNGIFGNVFKGGAEVTTIGRGKFINPDASDHHVDIGPDPVIMESSPLVKKINHLTFDAFGRLLSYKVLFYEMYRRASLGGAFMEPCLDLPQYFSPYHAFSDRRAGRR
ncbi:MAG: hypothetical protein WCO69_02275 [Candidatus Omnitrophota bacterium]